MLSQRMKTANLIVESGKAASGGKCVNAMVAEPGYESDLVVTFIVDHCQKTGHTVKLVSLKGADASEAMAKISKAARDCAALKSQNEDLRLTLVIADVPAMDGSQAKRVGKSVAKAMGACCNVVLSMLPESEQVLECIPSVRVFRSIELSASARPKSATRNSREWVEWKLSRGIPRLCRAAGGVKSDLPEAYFRNPSFACALADETSDSLRYTIVSDELRYRFAMTLLGSGTFQDLKKVLGKLDESILSDIAQNAPFFGVNLASRTFDCVAIDTLDGLAVVLGVLRECGNGHNVMVVRVCDLLCEYGYFERAAGLLSIVSGREAQALFCCWPAELMDAGAKPPSETDVAGVDDPAKVVAEAVYGRFQRATGGIHAGLAELDRAELSPAAAATIDAYRAQMGQFGEEGDANPADADDNRTSRYLRAHIGFLRGMASGRVDDALSAALSVSVDPESKLRSAYALWADQSIAEILLGDICGKSEMEKLVAWENECLVRGFDDLALEFALVAQLQDLLYGSECSTDIVDDMIRLARKRGFDLIELGCLIAAVVVDARAGNYGKARVRLARAKKIANELELSFYVELVSLLQLTLRCACGERVSAEEFIRVCSQGSLLWLVARPLAVAMDPKTQDRGSLLGGLESTECPKGLPWFVGMLANDCGDVSVRFEYMLPTPWKRALDRIGERLAAERVSAPAPESLMPLEWVGDEPREGVYIKVLGEFSVSVNGYEISGPKLDRRRAKCLLTLLAATSGHQVSRFVLMETIWPEYDYAAARQRIYEATSLLRSLFATYGCGPEARPIISNRLERYLKLNNITVKCDVDKFLEMAHMTMLNKDGTHKALIYAAKVDNLYKGDLVASSTDGTGVLEQRRSELRSIYVDAMVVGSSVALEAGKNALAVRYAEHACDSDNLREDAELCLLKALAATGRASDARRSYEEFAARVVSTTGFPPSKSLRSAAMQMLEGGSAKGDERVEFAELPEGDSDPDGGERVVDDAEAVDDPREEGPAGGDEAEDE